MFVINQCRDFRNLFNRFEFVKLGLYFFLENFCKDLLSKMFKALSIELEIQVIFNKGFKNVFFVFKLQFVNYIVF